MAWMGNDEEDRGGDVTIYTPEEAAMLGNTDMSNMSINDDAHRLINQHPEMNQFGSMPNLPSPVSTPLGLVANKKESVMLLGIGALIGLGIKTIWDHRTR